MKQANKRERLVKKLGVKQVEKGARRGLDKAAERGFFKSKSSK